MKQSMFSKQGQKGFTLLELLIVVTIIAILSVGAILAYEGLTEQAQAAAAANNNAGADQAIRNYRGVTGNYPNQWDHLVANDAGGSALPFVADETYINLAKIDTAGMSAGFTLAVREMLDEVGIEELQVRTVATTTAGVEPNLQHNEGASAGDSEDLELEDGEFPTFLVVVPTANSGTLCTLGGAGPVEIRANSINDASEDLANNVEDTAVAQNYMIKVNDNIGESECHIVLAMGFGHDAAQSTTNSNVAIAAAPAFVSDNIKPADNYARYIALFDIGVDRNDDDNIDASEFNSKPKMIGLIDPEGKVIDEAVAAANDANTND